MCVKVREIYESAIEAEPPYDLPDADCRSLCLRYAELERKLGEVSGRAGGRAVVAGSSAGEWVLPARGVWPTGFERRAH